MRKWAGMAAGAVLVLGAAGQVMAAQPSEKQVRQLFQVMHMEHMFDQMNSQMAGMMGQAVPCVPASYWQGFIDASGSQQLLGRMVPLFRSLISIPAGTQRMPLGRFVLLTVVGSAIWNTVFVLAGYLLGHEWHRVEEAAGWLQYAVVAAVVAVGAWWVVRRLRRRRTQAP